MDSSEDDSRFTDNKRQRHGSEKDNHTSHSPDESYESYTEDNAQDDALKCGYGKWQPKLLQKFNTPRFLLAAVCWFTFAQGFVVNGIVFVNLTAWEKLYELRGENIAWIVMMYDISGACFTLLFGYLGQTVHNGRILSIGAFAMSLGSLVMLIPKLISEPYELGPIPVDTCRDVAENANYTTSDPCSTPDASTLYYWLFLLGNALHGVGGAAVFTLAIPYMDTQIKSRNTPMYIGLMQGFSALGPAAGFFLGGIFLQIYVDYGTDSANVDLEPSDPRWVGAWWIGLAISSVASLSAGIIMACFPRELPSAKKYGKGRYAEKVKDSLLEPASSGGSVKEMSSVRVVLTTKIWLCLTFSGTLESAAVSAFVAFLPKVIQFQFNKTPVEAALFTGAVIVPGAALGQIIGGLIPQVLNSRMRGLILQCVVFTLISTLLSFQFLLRCESPDMAGVNIAYQRLKEDVNIMNSCNIGCNCTTYSYDPVCGSDNMQYFTPCFAGCSRGETKGDKTIYYDCACIPPPSDNSSALNEGGSHGWAEDGVCDTPCGIFYAFVLLFLALCLSTFITGTAGQAATIRSVPEKQKSLAVGLQSFSHKVACIPSPLLFGLTFDRACLVWQESCDVTGSCWVYDTLFLARGLALLCVLVKALSCVGFILAYVAYKLNGSKDIEHATTIVLNDVSASADKQSVHTDDTLS